MRYQLRYTSDLSVIRENNHWVDLIAGLRARPDYMIHIWDTRKQSVLWQSKASIRYGDAGIELRDKLLALTTNS